MLEHLDHPQALLHEVARVLRPGGDLVLTAPSWRAKPVLEFLAFRVGVVNAEEIRSHKRYYNKEELFSLVNETKLLRVEVHSYFQWKFNNFLVARKLF